MKGAQPKQKRTSEEKRGAKSRDALAAAAPETEGAAVEPPRKKKKKAPRPPPDEPPPAKRTKSKKGATGEEELPDLGRLSAADQGAALWASYQSECGGSFLEEEAFGAGHFCGPAEGGSLQAQLQAAAGADWRQLLARAPPGTPAGAPTCLVVAGAALRVLEVIRQLPDLHRAVPIAKLFSKHIKPAEQAAALAAGPLCVGVGTPARLDKLLALGALSLSRLKLLVIDCSRDMKKRTLLDIPETRRDLWALWRLHLAPKIAAGELRVLCC
jgi:hypothetical protein